MCYVTCGYRRQRPESGHSRCRCGLHLHGEPTPPGQVRATWRSVSRQDIPDPAPDRGLTAAVFELVNRLFDDFARPWVPSGVPSRQMAARYAALCATAYMQSSSTGPAGVRMNSSMRSPSLMGRWMTPPTARVTLVPLRSHSSGLDHVETRCRGPSMTILTSLRLSGTPINAGSRCRL